MFDFNPTVVDSPYTRWQGDDVHGHHKVVRPVWVLLDRLLMRDPDAPRHVVGDGLDMSGTVPGLLHGWFQTVNGDWLGVVNFAVPYADGRRNKVWLPDQLVPAYALKPRVDDDPAP
jgi:hypothetical protein